MNLNITEEAIMEFLCVACLSDTFAVPSKLIDYTHSAIYRKPLNLCERSYILTLDNTENLSLITKFVDKPPR